MLWIHLFFVCFTTRQQTRGFPSKITRSEEAALRESVPSIYACHSQAVTGTRPPWPRSPNIQITFSTNKKTLSRSPLYQRPNANQSIHQTSDSPHCDWFLSPRHRHRHRMSHLASPDRFPVSRKRTKIVYNISRRITRMRTKNIVPRNRTPSYYF